MLIQINTQAYVKMVSDGHLKPISKIDTMERLERLYKDAEEVYMWRYNKQSNLHTKIEVSVLLGVVG